MPRKVRIRVGTAVEDLEALVKKDFKELWKNHLDELETMAEWIEADAKELVPVGKTGKLRDSITCRVSRSNRYPGLIASASARGKTSFDYALIQEENDEFAHEIGQAHYLGDAFYSVLEYFYGEHGRKIAPLDHFRGEAPEE